MRYDSVGLTDQGRIGWVSTSKDRHLDTRGDVSREVQEEATRRALSFPISAIGRVDGGF